MTKKIILILIITFTFGCITTSSTTKCKIVDTKKKVLIISGKEYHKWKLTLPIIEEFIKSDDRLEVTTSLDDKIFGSSELENYDVIFLHYQNKNQYEHGMEKLEEFRKVIENGTGLVMVHFACGACQRWSEFENICARVWDPKLRGHDKIGTFKVNVIDRKHPIMKNINTFESYDELYTCLTGDVPIHVLADATSKIDGKVYPMAFTYQYGKGRVFQCLLGHDPKAFNDSVKIIFKNACSWAAGLKVKEN